MSFYNKYDIEINRANLKYFIELRGQTMIKMTFRLNIGPVWIKL